MGATITIKNDKDASFGDEQMEVDVDVVILADRDGTIQFFYFRFNFRCLIHSLIYS